MDGAIRPLADGCLRDKRVPVEAAIETEKQVIAPFCEWKHNGRPQATDGIDQQCALRNRLLQPHRHGQVEHGCRRIVFETGRMAPILFHGLSQLSLPVICVESRQAYQALKSLAALRPANPIQCRTSTQRTQAPKSVDTGKSLPP